MGKIIGVLALTCLVGCSLSFQKPGPDTSYGPEPTNYEPAIKAAFANVLKDPGSAQYQIGSPVAAYANDGLAYGGRVSWTGYVIAVQVNAKNSFGGYTGHQAYTVMMNGNSVGDIRIGSNPSLVHRVGVRGYSTTPEEYERNTAWAREKAAASLQPEQPPVQRSTPPPRPAPVIRQDATSQLQYLDQLWQEGRITPDEYWRQRDAIIPPERTVPPPRPASAAAYRESVPLATEVIVPPAPPSQDGMRALLNDYNTGRIGLEEYMRQKEALGRGE